MIGDISPPRAVTPAGLLAEKLERLREQLRDTEHADAIRDACELAGGLEPYLSACTTPESPALARLATRTRERDWSEAGVLEQEMLSGHVEGQALKFLVRLTAASRVLDVGMFTGYSALAMAEALPAHGRVVACEVDPGVAAFAQRCFDESPGGERIDVRVGPAADTLRALQAAGEVFDLVFVDADKPGYQNYVSFLLGTTLLAHDGLICVDNTLMQGEPWRTGEPSVNGAAIAAFNEALMADPRAEQVLLPLRDGLTLIRRA